MVNTKKRWRSFRIDAMLDLGATTFWENFTYQEQINAVGIDELPDPTRFNIHADGGAHCYIGLRASLCHGGPPVQQPG